MSIQFSQDLNSINVTAVVKDAHGNDVPVESLRWESSNPDLARVAGTNEMLVVLEHGRRDVTGICQLTFIADSDLGEGARPISHTEDINVTAGEGTQVSFQVS